MCRRRNFTPNLPLVLKWSVNYSTLNSSNRLQVRYLLLNEVWPHKGCLSHAWRISVLTIHSLELLVQRIDCIMSCVTQLVTQSSLSKKFMGHSFFQKVESQSLPNPSVHTGEVCTIGHTIFNLSVFMPLSSCCLQGLTIQKVTTDRSTLQ